MTFEDYVSHEGHDVSLVVCRRMVRRATGASLNYPFAVVLYCRYCDKSLIDMNNPKSPTEYYGEEMAE